MPDVQDGTAPAGNRLFLLASVIALSYVVSSWIAVPPSVGPLWKATGVVLLAVFAGTRGARLTALALALSAAGDVALALEPAQWIAGMAAFGLAHLFYLAAFVTLIRREGLADSGWIAALAVLALSAAMLVWFYPGMGALRTPGLLYQCVITAMVVSAMLSRAPMQARAGTLVFMLSDCLIAFELYRHVPPPPGAVWITYAAAQMMLAWSLTGRRV